MTEKDHAGCLAEHYGLVLKQLRELKKLSQEELAFKTGLDRTYVSMLERNRRQPSLATVEKIAGALSIKTSRFLKMVEDACSCEKSKSQQGQTDSVKKIKYEFSSRAEASSEAYQVCMEEVGESSYVVHFGTASKQQTYPLAGATMLSLEAIQFLGRLWGSGRIPEALSKDYKAWLNKLEADMISQRNDKA